MTLIDFIVILVFLIGTTCFGTLFSRRGGKDTSAFILGSRELPWWLAGLSASAAAFNADSPQHQSRKVRETGLQGAWFYWFNAISNILNIVFIARMYRRAEIQTVPEFYEIRYSGRGKSVARMWNALSICLIYGTAFVAAGMLGLSKVVQVLLELPPTVDWMGLVVNPSACIAVGIAAVALIYATTSGVWGVVWTDLVEFSIAIFCSYLLLFFVFREVGWVSGLESGLEQLTGSVDFLDFTPSLTLIFLFWMVLLPLSNFGGSQTDIARYLGVKDERQVFLTGIWKITTHFLLRGWPWYLCGLISIILISDADLISTYGPLSDGTADAEKAYPMMIVNFLPVGLTGLMIAGFLSAFMSSLDTLTHNNASVFVNDLYRPYIARNKSERHYVWAIRTGIITSAILGTVVAFWIDEIFDIIVFIILFDAGTGFLLTSRWFWWRVNAWADLAAHLSGIPIALLFLRPEIFFGPGTDFATPIAQFIGLGNSWDAVFVTKLLVARLLGVAIWLPLTLFLPPTDFDVLRRFYRRVRPYGFWGPVAAAEPDIKSPDSFGRDVLLAALGLVFYFSLLFCAGALFLAKWPLFLLCLTLTVTSLFILLKVLPRTPAFKPDHESLA